MINRIKEFLKKKKIKIDSIESFFWVFLVIVFLIWGEIGDVHKNFGGWSSYIVFAFLFLVLARFLLALSARKRGVELMGVFVRDGVEKKRHSRKQKWN